MKNQTTANTASNRRDDFAICVRPADDGQQSWELLDAIGERVMHGVAADQTTALSLAQSAVSAMRARSRGNRTR